MTDNIRTAIRIRLAERNQNQADLARALGRTRQEVNRYVTGRGGKLPRIWQEILDELDLELVVRPKDAE